MNTIDTKPVPLRVLIQLRVFVLPCAAFHASRADSKAMAEVLVRPLAARKVSMPMPCPKPDFENSWPRG